MGALRWREYRRLASELFGVPTDWDWESHRREGMVSRVQQGQGRQEGR
jgi:hypothetical protein